HCSNLFMDSGTKITQAESRCGGNRDWRRSLWPFDIHDASFENISSDALQEIELPGDLPNRHGREEHRDHPVELLDFFHVFPTSLNERRLEKSEQFEFKGTAESALELRDAREWVSAHWREVYDARRTGNIAPDGSLLGRAAYRFQPGTELAQLRQPVSQRRWRKHEGAFQIADAHHFAVFDFQTGQQHGGVIAWLARRIERCAETIIEMAPEGFGQFSRWEERGRHIAEAD